LIEGGSQTNHTGFQSACFVHRELGFWLVLNSINERRVEDWSKLIRCRERSLRIQAVGPFWVQKDVAQHTLRLRHQRSKQRGSGIRIAPSHPLIYRLSQQLTMSLQWTSVQNCTVCEV